MVPVMSLAVAIVTSLDTWLKPGAVWKSETVYTIKMAALRDNHEPSTQMISKESRSFIGSSAIWRRITIPVV
ncbi:hypothetical protein HDF11_002060 [Tunturiibacter psychrotolerans]